MFGHPHRGSTNFYQLEKGSISVGPCVCLCEHEDTPTPPLPPCICLTSATVDDNVCEESVLMGMGVGREMCVIWFVVERFRSHCCIVTAVAPPVCQESRKQRYHCFDRERERGRLHGNTVRQTETLTGKQAGRQVDR